MFVDEDGTIYACQFKRKGRNEHWDRISSELWRYKRTGEIFTIIKHGPRPLMCFTELILPEQLHEWEDVDDEEKDIQPETGGEVQD